MYEQHFSGPLIQEGFAVKEGDIDNLMDKIWTDKLVMHRDVYCVKTGMQFLIIFGYNWLSCHLFSRLIY